MSCSSVFPVPKWIGLFSALLMFEINTVASKTIEMHHKNLYCLANFNRARNPIELPNDRCCPPKQESWNGGIPYSSTSQGCCKGQLFNIFSQSCCPSGNIIQNTLELDRPTKILMQIEGSKYKIDNENDNQFYISAAVTWDEVINADTYEIEVQADGTETLEVSQPVLGTGSTMGLSITVLQNLRIGGTYNMKIKAIDCLNRDGDVYKQKFKVQSESKIVLI